MSMSWWGLSQGRVIAWARILSLVAVLVGLGMSPSGTLAETGALADPCLPQTATVAVTASASLTPTPTPHIRPTEPV